MNTSPCHGRIHTHAYTRPSALSSAQVQEANKHNNQMIGDNEAWQELSAIQAKFEGERVMLLDSPTRRFVREGPLSKQNRGGRKEFRFYLFTDKLVYGAVQISGTLKHFLF